MRSWQYAGILLLAAAAAAAQRVTVVPATSLEQLVESGKLVTVLIRGMDHPVEDPNLRIVELHAEHFVGVTEDGGLRPYLYDDIMEIRVQEGQVEGRRFVMPTALTGPQQQIVQRAVARARDIFLKSQNDQSQRIRAATLLTMAGEPEARIYLLRLARSGDVETELAAVTALYLAGDPAAQPGAPFPVDELYAALGMEGSQTEPGLRRPLIPTLLARGLDHGLREVRARSAALVGLTNASSLLPIVERQARDRVTELSVSAAKALVNMNQESVIPRLLELLMERGQEKGEAAVYGLSRLGNEATMSEVKRLNASATGAIQLRIAMILFANGEPEGREMLENIMNNVPTLADEATVLLARNGDWPAMQALNRRLDRRDNPTEENLTFRAKAAGALVQGGDTTGLTRMQDLLRLGEAPVTERVCAVIAELGRPTMLDLLQPPLESATDKIAIDAATAAMSLADPQFRERLTLYHNAL